VGFGLKTAHEWPNWFVTNRHYDPKPGLNICLDYLSLVQGYVGDFSAYQDPGIRLKIDQAQQARLQQIIEQVGKGPLVLVCAGSMWRNKQLDPATLSNFLTRVQKHLGCRYLLAWGSAEEKALAEQLHQQFPDCSIVLDRLPLPVLQNLMCQMDLVIAMDSLPLHLAGTTPTPTFSVFGASSAAKFKPEGARHRALQGTCPYGRTFEKRCPILRTCPTGACIRAIDPEELFRFFEGS
jgi:heptosyltransferase I